MIIYVCATEQEIGEIERNLLKIGQNFFHDEFNQIHFVEPWRSNCIDIALFSKHLEQSQSSFKKENKNKYKYKHTKMPLIEVSSSNCTKRVFRLPEESQDFLKEIQSKLHRKKIFNIEDNCATSLVKQSQKCLFNLILKIINCKYKKLLKEKRMQKKFEQINYDYFNSKNKIEFPENFDLAFF